MFFQLNLCYRQLGTSRESLIVQSQGSLPFTPPSSLLCSRVFFVSPVSCFIVVPFPSLLCLRAFFVLIIAGVIWLVTAHPFCAAQDGLPWSWCTPCPTGKLPAGWSKHQHADGGALYLRPDGRLVSEAPTWHETGLTGSEPPPLPGSTADEARCCC